ncbi:unnamed protein product [Choristocarpus tenellus]
MAQSNTPSERRIHLLTPELETMREPNAGVDLMEQNGLVSYEKRLSRGPRKTFSHFLSTQLQVLVKEKPRIMLAEKAAFKELLKEEPSGRPIEPIPIDILKRSFRVRKEVVAKDEGNTRDGPESKIQVPPDVPFAQQTTNKRSPAYRKQIAKRARTGASIGADIGGGDNPQRSAVKALLSPVIHKLLQKQWPGWGNPFEIVLTKKTAPKGYFTHVEKPMNLMWIKEYVARSKYLKVEEFEADLELMVNNAFLFNKPTEPVHGFAKELQAIFRQELAALKGNEEGLIIAPADKRPRIR